MSPLPNKKFALILAILVLLQMLIRLEEKSPYLYQTFGQYNLKDNSYGMEMGPKGQLIHFDAINYWSVEQIFSGNYRGGPLGSTGRPFYPMLASILDPYFHPYYSGLILNSIFWWLACLGAYVLGFQLSRFVSGGMVSALLILFAPGFINVCGQPMGYLMGYSLFIIFLASLSLCFRLESISYKMLLPLIFLILINDLVYEISGLMCFILLVWTSFKKLGLMKISGVVILMLATKFIWGNLFIPTAFSGEMNSGFDTRISHFNFSMLWDIKPWFWVMVHLVYGFFLSGFFWIPIILLFFFSKCEKKTKHLFIGVVVSISCALGYMGLLGETTGDFRFYREGRLIAFYSIPLIFLAAGALATTQKMPFYLVKSMTIGLPLLQAILSNLDLLGFKSLYYLFNYRSGYQFKELCLKIFS